MKKILALIMAAMLLLTLAACQPAAPGTNDPVDSTPSTPTEPSEPSKPSEPSVPTEPSVPSTPTEPQPPTELADSGYLAVGIVDAAAGTAKVVGDNGVIAEIKYSAAEAPVPGKVYSYIKNGETYELVQAAFINRDYGAWPVRVFDQIDLGYDGLYTHDGVNETFYTMDQNAIVFVRFSETEWRVLRGNDVIKFSGFPCGCYFTTDADPAGGNMLVKVMLVCSVDITAQPFTEGHADEANTYFLDKDGFGWSDGDLIIQ